MDVTDFPVLMWSICSCVWQQDLEVRAVILAFWRIVSQARLPRLWALICIDEDMFFFLSWLRFWLSASEGETHLQQDCGRAQSVSSKQWYMIMLHVFLNVSVNSMWYNMCCYYWCLLLMLVPKCIWQACVLYPPKLYTHFLLNQKKWIKTIDTVCLWNVFVLGNSIKMLSLFFCR